MQLKANDGIHLIVIVRYLFKNTVYPLFFRLYHNDSTLPPQAILLTVDALLKVNKSAPLINHLYGAHPFLLLKAALQNRCSDHKLKLSNFFVQWINEHFLFL